ncbi:hypothetical protein SAMN05421820_107130 [Pedobacter steynii]|uniref:Uncharacterized protein n=1 Tax=Pedobacter steynii TaxID=430522 RepID=A0A1H0ALE9_9SPHI|nr:hypothetical protein [Pedobacter steynii]NQX41328.1 hypothetical protein [Pedobacter steynii]SDN34134.1 hypothetical protein SAMN05421820_107130 [Pedobacter steynii]
MCAIKKVLENENAEINRSLFEHAAELKKKSAEINEKLRTTIQECEKILHPERAVDHPTPKK